MDEKFPPFGMPDFASRPDGESKLLKDAYVVLRRFGLPDRDLFIYPQGEFNDFKGEILDQRPEAGEIVSSGQRVILVAAVRGICELMPDLFTDHREDIFQEEFNPRGGAKRLFALFDSAFLKMLCRLDWVRDIYAGIYSSGEMVDYSSVLLSLRERGLNQISREVLGFVLPRLYRFLGTEAALHQYVDSVMGFESAALIDGWQMFPLPEEDRNRLGGRGRLGADMYLGESFKGSKPMLDICLFLHDLAAIKQVVPGSEGHRLLTEILEFTLPYDIEQYNIEIRPDPERVRFESGGSHLGYSTVLSIDME